MRHTPLHELHLELGARMVEFAGYAMPVQYPPGIIREHLHTRSRASLFDVSHMGQVRVCGPGAASALERLVPGDIVALAPGRQRYTFLTGEAGGVLDDLMVANTGPELLLVVNASRKQADLAHLRAALEPALRVEVIEERALLALQGPEAAAVMRRVCAGAAALPFMSNVAASLDGVACFISRSGYTGEDGFEISVPAADAVRVAGRLLGEPGVAPAGLGARDSLRLEAGLCLYGHELDASTSPIEAGLAWTIPRVRRAGGERAGGFPGAPRILRELRDGPVRRLVGLRPEGRAPIREGEDLYDAQGEAAGRVTSGGFGPTLDSPVALAYVAGALAGAGGSLHAVVRGKPRPCAIVSLPFVAHRYFKRA
ncbi:MAG: glycine cleavage system aminomethyltransferase GcvT [Burkholderiales bacterium]|nr:glycine cleavage system aminomethyltransferase GcvT [Burkholderiales bacterium]